MIPNGSVNEQTQAPILLVHSAHFKSIGFT